jgi:hypothetical protein
MSDDKRDQHAQIEVGIELSFVTGSEAVNPTSVLCRGIL